MLSTLRTKPPSIPNKLICGFLRIQLRSKKNQFPLDIVPIIIEFYNEEISWKIAINELTAKLNADFTTFTGPELTISDYKFILKLKRSRNNLYFGIWYQNNKVIEKALHDYFKTNYDLATANKIVDSFNFITNEEEFDDIPLIIHDISDPTYSCIIEHIEGELRNDALLILTNGQITNIKQNIIRIIIDHNPTNSSTDSFIFRVRYHCIENDMEFRKLYRFDTNQVTEKGAEMHWRHKYNNYKDVSLDFHEFIKDKEQLTFKCYVDMIGINSGMEPLRSDHDEDEKQCDHTLMIDDCTKKKLIQMQHGDHLYLCDSFGGVCNSRFAVFTGYYHGRYNIFLQQLYPNMRHYSNKHQDIMVTEIDEAVLKINDVQYGKARKIRFDAEDDIGLIAKIWGREWIVNDNEDKKGLKMHINIIGIS